MVTIRVTNTVQLVDIERVKILQLKQWFKSLNHLLLELLICILFVTCTLLI